MRAHRTDLVSFAFGLLFLALAAWWLLAQVVGLVLPPVGWFLAGGLILIGLLGLVGALRSSKQANQPEQPGPGPAGSDTAGTGGHEATESPDARWDEAAGTGTDADRSTDDDRTLDLADDADLPRRRGPAA
ncbi:hypothetical protein EG812_07680 [Verrucosispora sp. FIM060022]|nr:hypothetical protein EG812_07680 [Verrucosispora sp. FIM060022]